MMKGSDNLETPWKTAKELLQYVPLFTSACCVFVLRKYHNTFQTNISKAAKSSLAINHETGLYGTAEILFTLSLLLTFWFPFISPDISFSCCLKTKRTNPKSFSWFWISTEAQKPSSPSWARLKPIYHHISHTIFWQNKLFFFSYKQFCDHAISRLPGKYCQAFQSTLHRTHRWRNIDEKRHFNLLKAFRLCRNAAGFCCPLVRTEESTKYVSGADEKLE